MDLGAVWLLTLPSALGGLAMIAGGLIVTLFARIAERAVAFHDEPALRMRIHEALLPAPPAPHRPVSNLAIAVPRVMRPVPQAPLFGPRSVRVAMAA